MSLKDVSYLGETILNGIKIPRSVKTVNNNSFFSNDVDTVAITMKIRINNRAFIVKSQFPIQLK